MKIKLSNNEPDGIIPICEKGGISVFKSKGFTIGFSILAALNVFLVVALILLATGKADNAMDKIVHTTPASEEAQSPTGRIEDLTTPEVPTEAPNIVRTLTKDDPHSLPVVDELIKEQGSFTINESAAVGVVFHKLPVFDSAEAEGNIVNYRGTFTVDGKIYVTDSEGKPYLMYHTEDGYYVTGNPAYVKYTSADRTVPEDAGKVTDYVSQDGRTEMTIHQEDGDHLIFTLKRHGETVFENAIAVYDHYGQARFEYMSGQGAGTGDLTFSYEEGKVTMVTVMLTREINLEGDKISTLSLSVKP